MAVTANRTQQFWVVYLSVYCIIVVYCETYVSLNANVHIRLSIQYSFGMFWSIVPEKTNILFPFWPSRWGLLLSRWYYSFLLCQYSYCLLTLTHILLPGGVKGDVPVMEIMHLQVQMWKGVFVSCFFQRSWSKSSNYSLAETVKWLACLLGSTTHCRL